MLDFLFQYGLWGLFVASFLSATVLPLSSEGVVSLLIYGGFDWQGVILVASIGNWLGGMTCYALGYWGNFSKIERWLGVKQQKIERFQVRIEKWGSALACLCWVPIIGDVLAIGLGFFRCNWYVTCFFMFVGKATRYLIWAYLTLYVVAN